MSAAAAAAATAAVTFLVSESRDRLIAGNKNVLLWKQRTVDGWTDRKPALGGSGPLFGKSK